MVAMLTESASVFILFLYPINIKETFIYLKCISIKTYNMSPALIIKQVQNLCKDKNAKQKKGTRCSI